MKRPTAFIYLVSLVQASPIVSSPGTPQLPNAHRDYGSRLSCLIAATILGSSVTLLLVAKWIYLSRQYRRTGNVSRKARFSSRRLRNGNLSLPEQCGFPIFPEDFPGNKGGKSGVLAGLFGSPAWETRYSNIVDAMSEQLSFTRITGTSPRLRCHSSNRFSNSANVCVDNASKAGTLAIVVSDGLFQGMRDTSRLSREILTQPPALVRKDKSDDRYDLPTQPSLFVTGGSSTANHYLLDHSFVDIPKAALLSPLSSLSSWSIASTYRAPQGASPRKCLDKEPTTSYCDGLNLLHPNPQNFCTLSTSEDMNASPTSEHESTQNPPYDTFDSPQSLTGSAESSFKHCGLQCDSSFTIGDFTAGDNAADFPCSVRRSPDTSEATITNCGYTAVIEAAKIKSRTLSMQHAQMRSPKVGPSPLRSMFLPGNDENHGGPYDSVAELGFITPRSLFDIDGINISDEADAYGSVAKLSAARRKTHSKNVGQNSNTRSRENSDSDQIFGLIQELVHETKSWDDSLFVDHKFKAMIDDSKLTNCSFTNIHKKRRRSCRPPYPFCGRLADIPEVEGTLFLS